MEKFSGVCTKPGRQVVWFQYGAIGNERALKSSDLRYRAWRYKDESRKCQSLVVDHSKKIPKKQQP
jgi:hypothetical protein